MKTIRSQSASEPLRDRLLNAAEQVVSRQGTVNLTLEAVAKEARVSKGGLLYHFPSKSALIRAIVERLAERCETSQEQALAQDRRPAGTFTRAYIAARAELPDPKRRPIHTALLAAVGTHPDYLDPFRRHMAEWQARLEKDGIDPVTATVVRLAMDGLVLCSLLGLPTPVGKLRNKVMARLLAMTDNKWPKKC